MLLQSPSGKTQQPSGFRGPEESLREWSELMVHGWLFDGFVAAPITTFKVGDEKAPLPSVCARLGPEMVQAVPAATPCMRLKSAAPKHHNWLMNFPSAIARRCPPHAKALLVSGSIRQSAA